MTFLNFSEVEILLYVTQTHTLLDSTKFTYVAKYQRYEDA